MKCISLWQPYATLIAVGAKKYETRSWCTGHQGPLLIHAAKSKEGLDVFNESPFREVLAACGYERPEDLPFGQLVALVDLVECIPTESIRDRLEWAERQFGGYSDGRYAWRLDNVQRISNAPLAGKQGLFDAEIPASAIIEAEAFTSRAPLIEERPAVWVQGDLL